MQKIYPAIFTHEDDDQYTVYFPDLQGCETYGENVEHATLMAIEALELYIEALINHNMPIPIASSIEKINKTLEGNEFTSFIVATLKENTK